MKKILSLMAMALLGITAAHAQMFAWELKTTTGTYTELTGATAFDLQGLRGTDLSGNLIDADGNLTFNAAEDVTGFPIGFDLNYNGQTMKYFAPTTNGLVQLSPTEAITTTLQSNISNFSNTNGIHDAFGIALREKVWGHEDTEISYKLEGSEGSRVLVIQYKNLGYTPTSVWDVDSCATLNFQLRIYEATGNISVQVNGFKPYDRTGSYNFMRIGLLGDSKDCMLVHAFDGSASGAKDQFISYNDNSYPADGTTYTFQAPEDCMTPEGTLSNLQLTSTTSQISGTFKPSDADHYLVLASPGAPEGVQPVDKKKYAVGDELGNAKVIATVAIYDDQYNFNDSPSFKSPNNMEPNTEYTVILYPFNSIGANGPLYGKVTTATVKTKPDAPESIAVTAVTKNAITVSAKAKGDSPILIAFTDQQEVNSYDQYLTNGVFGEPTGTYSVGDAIEGGGKVVYIGPSTDALQISDLSAGTPCFLRAWSSDGNGGYSTVYLDLNDVTTAELPWKLNIDETLPVGEDYIGWHSYGGDNAIWTDNARAGYITCQVNAVADEAVGTEAWYLSPYIQLAPKSTRLKTGIAGTMSAGWMASGWTLQDGEEVKFQVTKDGQTFEDVLVINKDNLAETTSANFQPFQASFTKYAGEQVRLRIYIKRLSRGQTQFNRIELDETPEVEEPWSVAATDIAGGDVTVEWQAADNIVSYEVSYKQASAEEWSEPVAVTEKKIELTGLVGLTAYQLRVRGITADGKVSPWSDVAEFTTGFAVPFEFTLSGAKDMEGWAAYSGVLATPTELEEGGDVQIRASMWGSRTYRTQFQPWADTNSWLVTPKLNIGNDAKKQWVAKLGLMTQYLGENDLTIKVVVAKDGETFNEADVIGTIAKSDLAAQDEEKEFEFPFSGCSGSIRLGFYFEGTGEDQPFLEIMTVGLLEGEQQEGTYQFVPSEWIAGDAGRISPDKVVADDAAGTITVSQTGQNNVALLFRSANTYQIPASDRYFVIKGKGLSTASGASYLWWLNNTNNGSQIEPTDIYTDEAGETVLSWDCATIAIGGTLGLSDSEFKDDGGWSTTFGLTLADDAVPAVISYIGFQSTTQNPAEEYVYEFVASEWPAGDPGRISPSNVIVDQAANTITVSQTGQNNVALNFKTDKTYYLPEPVKYFVIKATGLSTAEGDSYLWWLNAKNNGGQVAPTKTVTTDGGETIFMWDITADATFASGFNANGISYLDGQGGSTWGWTTTFGMTLADPAVPAVISYIGYEADDITTGISAMSNASASRQAAYNLQGQRVNDQQKGLLIIGGKKVLVK